MGRMVEMTLLHFDNIYHNRTAAYTCLQYGIVCIVFADYGRQKIRRCICSILPTATLSTEIKRCLLMAAVFSVHTADRYGAYSYFINF